MEALLIRDLCPRGRKPGEIQMERARLDLAPLFDPDNRGNLGGRARGGGSITDAHREAFGLLPPGREGIHRDAARVSGRERLNER